MHVGCNGPRKPARVQVDCNNSHIKDSIINRFIDNGAEKLPNGYNNPAWGSWFDSVIAFCPDIAVAYQLKAIPYIKNGEYAKAFALNNKAVELDPQGYTAYRGFLKCIFTKDYEGAIIDFQKAQQLTPNGGEMDHTYKFYEGLCNLELGNYSKAEENFYADILIQTGGDKKTRPHFNTLLYVGILYYEMNNYRKSKEYLQQCLGVYEQLPEANYYLAMVYKQENNRALKNKYLQTAKQSITDGYTMSEDNLYYAYYPHQVTLYEVEQELENK
jgi:tetratricopeptide (TPR) repeat protein